MSDQREKEEGVSFSQEAQMYDDIVCEIMDQVISQMLPSESKDQVPSGQDECKQQQQQQEQLQQQQQQD